MLKTPIEILHAVARIIKSAGTILGFLAMVYVGTANLLSNTKFGQTILSYFDPLINPTRLTQNYVYYEIGENGILTKEGRLAPVNQSTSKPYHQIGKSDIFQANSTVRIRNAPTGSADKTGVIALGECVQVVSAEFPLSEEELGNAISGGWLNIEKVDC
jgi:hypothetical protein